jgi:DNA-binding transcriptional regulator YbjK
LTHRAVAERAGVPLSATTYYFESKEELFQEAVELAAAEEVERLEQLVLDLAPRELSPADWAREVSAALWEDLEAEPARPVAFYEFVLEAARSPELRPEVAKWEAAQLRLAEVGLRAAGSPDPETDAMLVVATITGLVLAQLGSPYERFEQDVLRPALERLFVSLTSEQRS